MQPTVSILNMFLDFGFHGDFFLVYFVIDSRYTRATLKVVPPILLCLPMVSELDVDDMEVDVEPSNQFSVTFCCQYGSRGAV